jgi:hypothetical protein
MNDETKQRIIDEVKKSGHPTCIKASNILIKKGWYIKNAPRYFDDSIKKYRELDLMAQKESFIFKSSMDSLIIECKKNSSSPWVFFKQKKKNKSVYTLNIAEMTSGKIYEFLKNQGIFKKHPYYDKESCAYYFVGFKKQDKEEGREIDTAINQVISGLFFYVNQMMSFIEKNNFTLKNPLFYYPLIIFEGDLFEINLDGEKIEVNETNHIRLLVEKEFEDPAVFKKLDTNENFPLFSKEIIIDIVKLKYLGEYLDKLKLSEDDTTK